MFAGIARSALSVGNAATLWDSVRLLLWMCEGKNGRGERI